MTRCRWKSLFRTVPPETPVYSPPEDAAAHRVSIQVQQALRCTIFAARPISRRLEMTYFNCTKPVDRKWYGGVPALLTKGKGSSASQVLLNFDLSGPKETSEGGEVLTVNQNLPRVSVGMSVYNGERYVRQAIESILSRTFPDLELIISANASSDATEGTCRDYAAKDPRLRYYKSHRNRGAAWNHNRVVELARGEYFKWQCYDDYCDASFPGRMSGHSSE
jgi:hypothetical protein